MPLDQYLAQVDNTYLKQVYERAGKKTLGATSNLNDKFQRVLRMLFDFALFIRIY